MPDYDLIIRGGTLADGTGGDLYDADIAVTGGTIAAIGKLHGQARQEIDAKGLLVTPGFVDIHTHFDGHVTWTDRLSPTSTHGVTTALFGNCGVGFAPCHAEDRGRLVRLMEGVEDIPEVVLTEGLPWNWTSFPEYLDSLDSRRFDIDIAAQVPHAPLRVFVMGQCAADREPATAQDIAQMATLAREAMEAGAYGFSTSRSINHRASDGSYTPTLQASHDELTAIARAIGQTGRGVLQFISDFEDVGQDFALVRDMVTASGRPLSMTVIQLPHAPMRWQELLAQIATANKDGLPIRGQVCGRPVGLFLGFGLTFAPFAFCPTYQDLVTRPLPERISRLLQPETRTRILAEFAVPLSERTAEIAHAFAGRTVNAHSMAQLVTDFTLMFPLGDPPEYEPAAENSLAATAQRQGISPAALAYDMLSVDDGQALIYVPAANFAHRSLDDVRTMLVDDNTILGLGDSGAHSSLICDASFTTYMLTHWARDRKRGLSLPAAVHALTAQGARAVGFTDRGVLAPGYRADINVIDFANLQLHPPRIVTDLPGGGRRLSQGVTGYRHTIVHGIPTYRDGQATGTLPGRLLRSGHR